MSTIEDQNDKLKAVDERLETLEALLEQQQETIEQQQAELDRRAEQIERLRAAHDTDTDERAANGPGDTAESTAPASASPFDATEDPAPDGSDTGADDSMPGTAATRRAVLTSGSVLGLFGLGVGTASADAQGSVGTSSDPVNNLYANNINDVSSLDGGGSAIAVDTPAVRFKQDGSASNPVIAWDGDVDTGLYRNAQDDLRLVANSEEVLAISDTGITTSENLDLGGNKLTDSSGEMTIEASSANGVTINTDGSNRALSLGVPSGDGVDTAGGNIVAGHPNNVVNNGAAGAVIGGGGNAGTGNENTVEDHYGVVGGGEANQAGSTGSDETNARWATVGGGISNTASDSQSTVGGGSSNTASGSKSTVGGGTSNTASNLYSTVGGGESNTASGDSATVPGGAFNTASGPESFAAGLYAKAADDNAFVWNDASGASDSVGGSSDKFSSSTTTNLSGVPSGTNTFSVKATSGVRFVTSGDNTSHAYVDTSGNVVASNTLDAQGGTVQNSAGSLTVSTSSGDLQLNPSGNVDVNGNDIEDSGTTIWDTSNSYIPTARLESDSVTVTAGDGLKNGGTVSLGGSTRLDVEPTDFAGTFLSDDGSDNLTVDIGDGLENDGSDNIRVDASALAGSGLSTSGNDLTVSNSGNWEEADSDDLLEPKAPYTGIDVTDVQTDSLNGGVTGSIDVTSLTGNGLTINSNSLGIATEGVAGEELDQTITPTWTGRHTWDTGAGPNLALDETGIFYSTNSAETLNLRNAGTGSVTLQEDGTTVVKETLSLTGGHAVQALGDLSTDRTVAVDATALSGTYLGDSGSSTALSVNLGNGLEGDGSDNVRVNGGAVAGNVLSENGSNPYQIDLNIGSALTDNTGTLDIATDGVTGTEIDLSTIAGNNITVDGSNNELDAQTPALAENDSDNLLETTGGEDGIDVTTVRVTNLNDASGNAHLTLNSGGPLSLNQPLNLSNNNINDVASIAGGGDAIALDDGLNLNSNSVTNLASIGGGGTSITLNDTLDVTSVTTLLNNGSGTTLPGTSTDGEIRVFDDTGAGTPSGRIQFQANGLTFTVNADAGDTYRDEIAFAEAMGQEPIGPDETRCYVSGKPFDVGDAMIQHVDQRVDASGEEDYDEIHAVPMRLDSGLERSDLFAAYRERVDDLEAELDARDARIDDQQDRIETLEAENEQLRDRLAAIESQLGMDRTNEGVNADD